MELGGEAGGATSPGASPGGTPTTTTLILVSALRNLETVLGAGALSEGSDAAAPGD